MCVVNGAASGSSRPRRPAGKSVGDLPERIAKIPEPIATPCRRKVYFYQRSIRLNSDKLTKVPIASAVTVTINRERGMIPLVYLYREVLLRQFLPDLFFYYSGSCFSGIGGALGVVEFIVRPPEGDANVY